MLNGVTSFQKRIGLVLYLEQEKFASKTIPLFYFFFLLLLWEEFWRVLNSCMFRTKYFHHMKVFTFSGGEYEVKKKNYQFNIKKNYKTEICSSLFAGLIYVRNNISLF